MSATIEELRPRAFAIAYRMLGRVSDAEDIVQEALLRVHRAMESGERIRSPQAFTATVVTRLALDELKSARVQREEYVGEWIPEPLLTTGDDDPAAHAEMADSLSMAFLVLLESLSPAQRAAMLLHDVFDYPYPEIARILGKTEAACRQLVLRARRHVRERRPRFDVDQQDAERLADLFFAAVRRGDLEGLESALAADVSLHGDGGGKVPALARPVAGRDRVARVLLSWSRAAAKRGLTIRQTLINGQPGALTLDPAGRVFSVLVLDIGTDGIRTIRGVVNPDKLAHLRAV